MKWKNEIKKEFFQDFQWIDELNADRAKKIGYRYAFKTRRIELISERQRAGQMIRPERLSDIECPRGIGRQKVSTVPGVSFVKMHKERNGKMKQKNGTKERMKPKIKKNPGFN